MTSPRRTKLETLFAVFEHFYTDLAKVPAPLATKLCENWKSVRMQYLNPPPGVERSELAQGLEQGLREVPLLLRSLPDQYRSVASKAYHAALESEYPAFLTNQQERLAKVVGRGRILGESEFHLVRYAIDIGERGVTDPNTLRNLYRLAEVFQTKGHRGA